ncbi:hypothetical protein U1Q18_025184, partial [Sarracenia purpurea var. burkii]
MASSDPTKRSRPGQWPPAPESKAMPPSSWAKRTGFRPKFSGETNASDSGQIVAQTKLREPDSQADLEAGRARPAAVVNGEVEGEKVLPAISEKDQQMKRRKNSDGGGVGKSSAPTGANGQGTSEPLPLPSRRPVRNEEVVDVLPQTVDDDGLVSRHSHMKYELRDTPGLGELNLHYISMLGSLVLVPLVIVPAMGGSNEDTANVVSTVLFVSGVTTLLHTSFGSRLPLIQGYSTRTFFPHVTFVAIEMELNLNLFVLIV